MARGAVGFRPMRTYTRLHGLQIAIRGGHGATPPAEPPPSGLGADRSERRCLSSVVHNRVCSDELMRAPASGLNPAGVPSF